MSQKIYDMITEKIIKQLEEGKVPWHKPWNVEHGMPKNLVSKKNYRGINVWLLASVGHESPYWLSYKQCKNLGGKIKESELKKYMPVIFWNWIEKEQSDGTKKKIPFLRYYRVYNSSQCEGIKVPPFKKVEDKKFNPLTKCEEIVNNMPNIPQIDHGKSGAMYSPSIDVVGMPDKERFDTPENYYCSLFHELTHATGHKSRLNRAGITEVNGFGTVEYSKEELVAEMGASFLCGTANIENVVLDNSSAYIKGWLKKLKDDTKLLVQAGAQAQKASDYILNITHKEK